MKRLAILIALLLLVSSTVFAQEPKTSPALEKLAARASKVVDVTLDRSMLQIAGRFLDTKDPDEAQAKRIINNLRGIYVHSYGFEKEGEYTQEDISLFRTQFREPLWSRIVDVRSKGDGENVEVYARKEDGKISGLAIIAMDTKRLTLVSIDGTLDPDDLAKLGGQFGIPQVEIEHRPQGKKGEDK